jgi:hypothetical protein
LKNIFVHLGAGAGDLDPRSNFRCGFTELIKKKCRKNDLAYIVDANPKNINKLHICYQNFKNVLIFNLAITNKNSKEYEFFFTDDDAPHYQVCSLDINHVKKHYPYSEIKSFKTYALNINEFLKKFVGNKIDYLSIDLEGIDYQILMELNLSEINIKNMSIEHLHLSKKEKKNMVTYLNNFGYTYFGDGYDHNHFDYLFIKKKNWWNRFMSNFLYLVNYKKLKYFNKLILDFEDGQKKGQ